MLITAGVFLGAFVFWSGLVLAQRYLIGFASAVLIVIFAQFIVNGQVTVYGLLLLLLFAVIIGLIKNGNQRLVLILAWVAYAVIVFLLGIRVLPLFSAAPAMAALGPDGLHEFAFPPEKIILLLIVPTMVLLPWSYTRANSSRCHAWSITIVTAVGLIALLSILAVNSGFATFALSSASVTYLVYWLSYNLFYTCVIEEAAFRGLLQTALIRGLGKYVKNACHVYLGVLIAAVIFGMAHAGGGLTYVVLAAIAGFFYGLVYQLTGRLHHAVLVHFSVNATWQMLFAG